jgi:hypothetical protein
MRKRSTKACGERESELTEAWTEKAQERRTPVKMSHRERPCLFSPPVAALIEKGEEDTGQGTVV